MVIHKRLRKIKWRLGGSCAAPLAARDGPVQSATAGHPCQGPGDRNISWFENWFALGKPPVAATAMPSPPHRSCTSGFPEHRSALCRVVSKPHHAQAGDGSASALCTPRDAQPPLPFSQVSQGWWVHCLVAWRGQEQPQGTMICWWKAQHHENCLRCALMPNPPHHHSHPPRATPLPWAWPLLLGGRDGLVPTCLFHLRAPSRSRLCPSPSAHPELHRAGVTRELDVATGKCSSASDSPSQPTEGKSRSHQQRATTRWRTKGRSSRREALISTSQKQHPSTFHRNQSKHLMISKLKIGLK